MQINFALKHDPRRPLAYVEALTMPERLYYEAYISDVEIEFEDTRETFENVPMLYFVATLQDLLVETFLTGQPAVAHLWDTGLKFSLECVADETVALEIPREGARLKYPAKEFVIALRNVGLELLLVMYNDDTRLLAEGKLFAEGSVLQRAAQLILQGRLQR